MQTPRYRDHHRGDEYLTMTTEDGIALGHGTFNLLADRCLGLVVIATIFGHPTDYMYGRC
jgi:hypothetical protein